MSSMTIPLYRGDDLLELEVDFTLDPAEPDVGIFCASAAPSKARVYRTEKRAWVEIELSEREWDTVANFIEENWEEDDG